MLKFGSMSHTLLSDMIFLVNKWKLLLFMHEDRDSSQRFTLVVEVEESNKKGSCFFGIIMEKSVQSMTNGWKKV
jgi:hypothetical protein